MLAAEGRPSIFLPRLSLVVSGGGRCAALEIFDRDLRRGDALARRGNRPGGFHEPGSG
jgi:hypothetical protein